VAHVQKILQDLGWDTQRLAMMNMSAGMGEVFARTACEFTEKIKQLGPSPVKQMNTDSDRQTQR
jgi:coenzyme F420-reducing hydrogenase delta subunit